MHTPSTGADPVDAAQYDVSLAIPAGPGQPALIFETVPVVASELLEAQGIHALIGRDILGRCVLHYNGAMGIFTVAY